VEAVKDSIPLQERRLECTEQLETDHDHILPLPLIDGNECDVHTDENAQTRQY
jgi:hypothetical protein